MAATTPSPAAVPPASGAGWLRAGRGLLGPRRGRHELAAEEFEALALPVGDDGVVIGTGPHEAPAVLGVARPVPFEAVLIGGVWTAQVIALRTAGTGARIAVETGRRRLWTALAQAANGGQPCVTLHDVGRVPPQGPSVHSPVLVVRDCGARPPRGRVVTAPWQSVLTLLPFAGPDAPRLLGGVDLVGVQRVSPEEAQLLGRLLGLPQADVEALPTLPETVTLWCARGSWTYVDVRVTEAETGLLGAPRRVD
ncbi:hypothetical protein [Streptomyces sp. NPDC008001]|uniref:hypothetical protein n=1 Tax=Streptomyces sp. NPDC008001 TaxID=3364804 RepID=UPI0036E57465